MTIRSSTMPVPTSDDGSYVRPRTIQSQIFEKMKVMPKVDAQGRELPRNAPDPSIVDFVPEATAPPTLAQALSRAADAVPGADIRQLLDSQKFCEELGVISPSDSLGLQEAIRAHMPAPTQGMKPNPAQGSSNASAPGPVTGSVLDAIHARIAAKLNG